MPIYLFGLNPEAFYDKLKFMPPNRSGKDAETALKYRSGLVVAKSWRRIASNGTKR